MYKEAISWFIWIYCRVSSMLCFKSRPTNDQRDHSPADFTSWDAPHDGFQPAHWWHQKRRLSISHSDIHDLPSVFEASLILLMGFELDSTPTSLQNSVELAVWYIYQTPNKLTRMLDTNQFIAKRGRHRWHIGNFAQVRGSEFGRKNLHCN